MDLAGDIPPQDVRLVATTTTLLARQHVHPALLQLFSQTALALHGQAGWFSRTHEFPNVEHTEFAISDEAQRAIRNGIPLLQRYLPFAYANLIERMWLAPVSYTHLQIVITGNLKRIFFCRSGPPYDLMQIDRHRDTEIRL